MRRPGASSNLSRRRVASASTEWPDEASLLPRAALDLREPLTVLIGGIETIRRRGEEMSWDDYEAVLGAMSQRAHRLAESIAGVFLAERIVRGLEPEAEACPVLALVREAAEGVLNRDEAGGVHFTGELDAVAWCDRQVLRQLAAALVADAIGAGRAPVTVRAAAHTDRVSLAIFGAGTGVGAKQRGALEAGAYAELPIGLHVAAVLARAAGSRLEPYDEPDGGGIVVQLPRA